MLQYGAVWCSMVQHGAAGSAAPKNSYGVSVAVERRAEVGDIVFLGLEVLWGHGVRPVRGCAASKRGFEGWLESTRDGGALTMNNASLI